MWIECYSTIRNRSIPSWIINRDQIYKMKNQEIHWKFRKKSSRPWYGFRSCFSGTGGKNNNQVGAKQKIRKVNPTWSRGKTFIQIKILTTIKSRLSSTNTRRETRNFPATFLGFSRVTPDGARRKKHEKLPPAHWKPRVFSEKNRRAPYLTPWSFFQEPGGKNNNQVGQKEKAGAEPHFREAPRGKSQSRRA